MTVEDEKIGLRRNFEGVRFERSPKWLRVRLGGRFIADSRDVHLLLEPRRLPVYYFPVEDVAPGVLAPSRRDETRQFFNVESSIDAAWTRDEWPGFVAFRWADMDEWFEEDEEVFVHARDPYHRVDVLRSTRHVQIELAGEMIADTQRPVLLFETGLPMRIYIPQSDIRMELLEHSATRTECPYKGEADHWSARIDETLHEDIAWSYKIALPDVAKIQGLIAFYQERVSAVYVDGELQPELITPWARRPVTN
jgi:uncharacterized protein (DUF427 family)